MRDHDATHILAEDIELAVNEAAVGAAEIGESLVTPGRADMRNGALGERFRRFGLTPSADAPMVSATSMTATRRPTARFASSIVRASASMSLLSDIKQRVKRWTC